jgi:hypothetical protein
MQLENLGFTEPGELLKPHVSRSNERSSCWAG